MSSSIVRSIVGKITPDISTDPRDALIDMRLDLDSGIRQKIMEAAKQNGYVLEDNSKTPISGNPKEKRTYSILKRGNQIVLILQLPTWFANDGNNADTFGQLVYMLRTKNKRVDVRIVSKNLDVPAIVFNRLFKLWDDDYDIDAKFVPWSYIAELEKIQDNAANVFKEIFVLPNQMEISSATMTNDKELPVIRCFISYAHAYQDHFEAFLKDFQAATKNLGFCALDIWTDEKIPLGDDWHEAIQEQVTKCDIAILLVSDQFMNSEYIKQEEVARLFERKESDGTLVVALYFYTCSFAGWPVLKKNQLYKPKGANYERADQDAKEHFCYANLVQLNDCQGKKIALDNPCRAAYMMDFVAELKPQLEKIVERKRNG